MIIMIVQDRERDAASAWPTGVLDIAVVLEKTESDRLATTHPSKHRTSAEHQESRLSRGPLSIATLYVLTQHV